MVTGSRSAALAATLFAGVAATASVSAQPPTPEILVDIGADEVGSNPSQFTASGASVYFRAAAPTPRLWASDGTAGGTRPLGPSPIPDRPFLADGGGLLYFVAGESGGDLWVTGGTDATTRQLTEDLDLGDCSDASCAPVTGASPASGAFVLFDATGADGAEPWISDGTADGTRQAADLRPGPDGSRPTGFTALGSRVLFVAGDGGDDVLWSVGSDGDPVAITAPLPGLRTAPSATTIDRHFFVHADAEAQAARGLWASDGTASGTVLVHPLAEDPGLSAAPPRLVPADRRVFLFELVDENTELWTSDGTVDGTELLAELPPFDPTRSQRIATHGDTLLFFVDSPDGTGREVWISDGTFDGTRPLALCPGGCGEGPSADDPVASTHFSFDDGTHGRELWVTDGTADGTVMVADVCPGPCSSFPVAWRTVGSDVVFVADDGTHDRELWSSDGGRSTATRLSDYDSATWFGLFPDGAVVADTLLFRADDGVSGLEPWRLEVGAGTAPCRAGPTALCLTADRFEVTATFRTEDGRTGAAQAMPLTADTGYFWFFNESNVEVVVKVLDACDSSDHFWVFAGGLTNVEVTLVVRDSETGVERTYVNPLGRAFQPLQRTAAFPTCP